METAIILLLAFTLDAAIGWPDAIYRRVGHPVTWIGSLIRTLDHALNRDSDSALIRRGAGVLTACIVIMLSSGLAVLMASILSEGWVRGVVLGILAWPLIATRALHTHVLAVAIPLEAADLMAARLEVAKIVGRDPNQLDPPGVARATLESLAENTSDGIVAPLFWGLIFGLPGLVAYKAINTLDSMIGHRSARHEAFGWASARVDDLVNLIPARLTAVLFASVSGKPGPAFAVMMRDASRHRSPNAGWPEAAMAGALGIRLSGPRLYEGRIAGEPWVNADARDPEVADIRAGLSLYRQVMLVLAAVLALLAIL